MERTDALRRVQFLKALPDETITTISEAGRVLLLQKGEQLFAENSPCIGLVVVLSGAVKVYKTDSRGRELTLGLEEAGASVAEVALFDGGNYPASAEAARDNTKVLVVHRDKFQQLMLQNPEMAVHALRALAIRLRKQLQMIEAQTLHTVRSRLAAYLVRTAAGRDKFPLLETNEAIGSHIGTVRDVVSRTLGNLKDAGAITVRGRWITVEDAANLKRIADAEER
jgi:CRP-like cAMP-binding protein